MTLFAGYGKALAFTFVCFSTFPSFSQTTNGKNEQLYQAGYKEYKTIDSSRRYKPGAVKGDRLFYRPQEIDVWYPVRTKLDHKPLDYTYFLSLFERRANSFQDSVKYQGLTKELLQHFSMGDTASFKTKSFLDAAPVKGNFPLIIYLSSLNGMSYENVPLFENLASHGYIVVSVSSVGRYPGNMTTKYQDVLEQVKDAEFALNFLGNKNMDMSRIGLTGYSYGGIAAALLAIQNPAFKGILSLDGSEKHYYGKDNDEDEDFNEFRNSAYWKPSALKCSYAYLESDHKQEEEVADSSYHFPTGSNRYYGRLTGAEHEDFSGVSARGPKPGSVYELVNKLTLDYFDQIFKAKDEPFNNDLIALASTKKIVLSPKITTMKSGHILLKGSIAGASNGIPLRYAGIGVLSGNCGTVSDDNGYFTLSVADTLINHTVRISSLGYHSRNYTVKELASVLAGTSVIRLSEQVNVLKEVTISAAKSHIRTVGNTSQSKFFNVGFPLRDLGSEVGLKISLGKKKVLLRNFNFNISEMRMDSCTFRLNIYALKDGMPAENLLKENIIKAIGNKIGAYTIDLTSSRILLNGTVLVSLEWIDGKTSSKKGAVFFSAGLLSSSYHRKTTEADWVKFKGLGAAFNLKVVEE